MKKIACLFPGQGAQYVGMGKDFSELFAISRETFEEADELLGFRLSKIIFEGPDTRLNETKQSQPAIFVASVAILRATLQQIPDLKPALCAGLSLGEYTALFASQRLSFQETLLLVKERAERMNAACEKTSGGMCAVLGLSAEEVELAIQGIEGVWVANYNCPGQTVISGTKEGVERATQALKEHGAKRVLPLTVHGAFHSGLMISAQEGLAPFIQKAPIQQSETALVMNVPGAFVETVFEMRRYLTSQVTQSVRWEQGIGAMEARGVDLYVEIGCGKTLSGMNKKIGVKAPTQSIEKLTDLDDAAKRLGEFSKCSC